MSRREEGGIIGKNYGERPKSFRICTSENPIEIEKISKGERGEE
jgi:hypothetical protein